MRPDVKGGGEINFDHIRIYHSSVKNINLVKSSDNYIDIVDIFSMVSIYESILTPFITAEITITDSNNLLADYPLLGGEFVRIRYNAPGGDETTKVSLVMRITGISNLVIAEKKQTYTINLISHEGFKNMHSSISKSFTGDGTTIVSKIFNDYLYTPETAKKIVTDPSSGSLKFVCPRWKPTQAINWVAGKTLSFGDGKPSFFFYETTKNFFFTSTETLFDRNANICVTDKYYEMQSDRPEGKLKRGYHYKVPGIPIIGADGKPKSGMTADESYQNVDKFNIDIRGQYLKDVRDGHLFTKNITHDLYNKSYKVQEYSYFKDFHKLTRLANVNKYPTNDMYPDTDIKITMTSMDAKLHDNSRNTFSEQYLLNRRLVMQQVNDMVISNFQVPGHPIINAGRLVEFNFPKIKTPVGPQDQYEPKYKGLYLIRDCIHIFVPVGNKKATYKCDTNIVKDGFDAI